MTRVTNHLKQHPEYLWVLAIMTLSLVLRLAFLHEPFERDEGQYATIAQVILRGGLPYRDAIEIKPPGTFYLYALAISLFGPTVEGIRIFTALYSLLTVIAVYGVTRLIGGIKAGLCATLIYGIVSTLPFLNGSSSNTEVFLVLPITAGVWFFLRAVDGDRRLNLCLAGLCAGIALLIKPVALPLVVLEFLLLFFLKSETERLRNAVLNSAAFALPIIICAATTLAYFSLNGGLADLLYWTVELPRRYKNSSAGGPELDYVLAYLTTSLLVPVLFGVPSAAWLARTKRSVCGIMPLLLILAACLSIALPGKYFPHYFIVIIPFLAIAAGVGLAHTARLPRWATILTILVLIAAAGITVLDNYRFYTVYSPEEVSKNKYYSTLFVDSVEIARHIKERTEPGDYIFQWGLEPELYFLADRRCPNPFLVSLIPGWSLVPQQATGRLMRSLFEKKPSYVVIQSGWSNFPGLEEVEVYTKSYCTEEKTIGYARIFRCSPD